MLFCNKKLLLADTPGHHAFETIREKIYTCADILLIFIDIHETFSELYLKYINLAKLDGK